MADLQGDGQGYRGYVVWWNMEYNAKYLWDSCGYTLVAGNAMTLPQQRPPGVWMPSMFHIQSHTLPMQPAVCPAGHMRGPRFLAWPRSTSTHPRPSMVHFMTCCPSARGLWCLSTARPLTLWPRWGLPSAAVTSPTRHFYPPIAALVPCLYIRLQYYRCCCFQSFVDDCTQKQQNAQQDPVTGPGQQVCQAAHDQCVLEMLWEQDTISPDVLCQGCHGHQGCAVHLLQGHDSNAGAASAHRDHRLRVFLYQVVHAPVPLWPEGWGHEP